MPITIGNLGRLASVSQRGRDIVFSFESSDLVLTPLLPNVIRHTWVPTHCRVYAGTVCSWIIRTERCGILGIPIQMYFPTGRGAEDCNTTFGTGRICHVC